MPSYEVLTPGRSFSETDSTVLVKFDVNGSSDATPVFYGCRLFSRKFGSFLRARSGKVAHLNTLLTQLGKSPIQLENNKMGIGYAELYALYRAVVEAPPDSRILVRVDNQGVVAGVMKGRFKSEPLNVLLGLLLGTVQNN